MRFVVSIDGSGNVGTNRLLNDATASWNCSSDRNLKENFEPVDGREVLAKVASLPIQRWNIKRTDASVKHVGPTAQDLRAAFGLGADDTLISTIDLDGVALAAIQTVHGIPRARIIATAGPLGGFMIDVRRLSPILLAPLLLASGLPAANVGSAFSYQGKLAVSGGSYTGTCDFTFTLWDAAGTGSPPTGGLQVAGPVTATALAVSGGLFTTSIDFGEGVLDGSARYLQIGVGCPSGAMQTTLAPRQALTPAPYAVALPYLHAYPGATSPTLVGGSSSNIATGFSGVTIAGGGTSGAKNQALGDFVTISGGSGNQSLATYTTIAGGSGNVTNSSYDTIGGGASNTSNALYGVIGGGQSNQASGIGATVPGGTQNSAAGPVSFAAGHRAKANHDGSFILADDHDFDFASGAANTFKARFTGGVRFVVGIDAGTGATTWSCLVTNNDASWSCSSDRNAKENFEAVDGGEVLERVGRLPILKWNAKGADQSVKHVGPMAQDFKAAFGLGSDDKMISTIDLEGVALAAIQGLRANELKSAAEIEELKARNAELEKRLRALECTLVENARP